ncbi:hypothetical protein Tco_1151188 [Tanacetum coccineum]
MRIERDNQPLSLTVMEKFGLKQLGFTEWIEIQALASKGKSKATNTLLKSLKAKFEWVKAHARKLGLSPPPELTEVGLTPAERKRKRTSKMIEEVFVKEQIDVDGTQRNLTLPYSVVGKSGLVIQEPEVGLLKHINQDSPEAREMYKIMEIEIESRGDVNKAKEIVRTNSDGMGIDVPAECKASEGNKDPLGAKHHRMIKGLAYGKASASNLKDIQVKDIVKEVKDYLKTYSPAKIDIRWYVKGML